MGRRATRRSAVLIALAMIAGVLAASVGTASAGTPTVVATPTTNLVSGDLVNVKITADVTEATHFYAVTQCGNADSSGNPIPSGVEANCAGAESLPAGYLQLISNTGNGFGAVGGGITAGTLYELNLPVIRTGIGTNGAQCVPVGGAISDPCTIAIAESDPAQARFGQVLVNITFRPPATVSIGSVTGQTGTPAVTTAARSTNVINVTGTNWDVGGTLTASLCNVALSSCDPAGLTGTATIGAGGSVSGALTVTAGATTGARAVKLTDGVQTASVPVQILGTRSITLAPAAGGVGLTTTVNGENFDANQPVAIQALNAAFQPLGAPVISGSSSTGAVNAQFQITDPLTRNIAVAEAANNPLVNNAATAFAFSADSCNNVGCTVLQTVTLAVNPGVINMAQAGNAVGMGAINLNGTTQTSTGNLRGITITDARGTLNGWSVTATMTNLSGPVGTNGVIPAGNMTVVTPTCGPQSALTGSGVGISAGTPGQPFDPTATVSLCTAAAGQGGGTYSIGSGLSLTVPANIRSGTYTSTITVLLS